MTKGKRKKKKGKRALTVQACCLLLLTTCFASSSYAQSITAEASSKNIASNEVVNIRVKVSNLTQANAPEPPETDEFELKLLPGVSQEMRQTFDNNGVQVTQRAYAYTFQARPLKTGVLTLPPFSVKDAGKQYSTQSIRIRVRGNAAEQKGVVDLPLLFLEISAEPKDPYVGQEVDLKLDVWVKQYNKDGIRLSDADFWRLRDDSLISLGAFKNENPSSHEAQRGDAQGVQEDYYVFSWQSKIIPSKPGPYDLGKISFGLQYPVSFSGRNIFGQIAIDRVKRIVESAKDPGLVVKPIPEEGRPWDFNGAVGKYTMTARAKPLEVQAGDPITLHLQIQGTGDLQRLSPPLFIKVKELISNFDISGEAPAGEMLRDYKMFSMTIRPLREDVGEIPRLPFSYFDPDTGKFDTSWTRPIKIKVRPAERLALANTPGPAPGADNKAGTVVETTEGLLANYTDPAQLLEDQSFKVGLGTWTVLASCPFLCAVVWVTEKRKQSRGNNTAQTRRNRAYSAAVSRLRGADGSDPAHRAREAVLGFIADRCSVPAAGLTRQDAVALAQRRGLPEQETSNLNAFLEGLENIEYGGLNTDGDVAQQARGLLDQLERHHLK